MKNISSLQNQQKHSSKQVSLVGLEMLKVKMTHLSVEDFH